MNIWGMVSIEMAIKNSISLAIALLSCCEANNNAKMPRRLIRVKGKEFLTKSTGLKAMIELSLSI